MAKILLAGDDPRLRTLVWLTLETSLDPRPELREAGDGKQALLVAWRERPDLILLDSNLSPFSGQQVCRELRRHPESAPLKVLLLRPADPEPHEPGFEDGYLVKPFSPLELLDKVEQLLSS